MKSLQRSGFTVKRDELIGIFLAALAFRFVVFLLSLGIMHFVSDGIHSLDDILNQYMKWDAHNYYRIAAGGYTYHTENGDFTTLAFFPLYPWLMRLFNFALRDLRLSGLALSALLYSGACCYLYKLFALDYNKPTVKRAIIYLSLFPHAFFFGTIMNESMLLFTSAAALYYVRLHKWYLVGIFGALAALSRAVGIVLAFPAAAEWFEEYRIFEKIKNKDIKSVLRLFFTKGIWIFLMLSGTGIYLFCNRLVTGDWFKFLDYQQKYWNHHSVFFVTGIINIFRRIAGSDIEALLCVHLPSAICIVFVIGMTVYGILRKNRAMYGAYLIAYLVMNMSVDYIISTPRYMTCAIPAFLFLADLSGQYRRAAPVIIIAMSIGFILYFAAYFGNMPVL